MAGSIQTPPTIDVQTKASQKLCLVARQETSNISNVTRQYKPASWYARSEYLTAFLCVSASLDRCSAKRLAIGFYHHRFRSNENSQHSCFAHNRLETVETDSLLCVFCRQTAGCLVVLLC